jgi:hypothetical protein
MMGPRFFLTVGVALGSSTVACALSLTGTGTATTLTGTLGTVEVIANVDEPILDGALTSGGLVGSGLGLGVTRVQYDLLNRRGNESIFEFRVDFPTGTNVVAAANPGAFRQADATLQTYWAGSNSATLLDSGFGLYTADRDNHGSEWIIDYQPDHVRWQHVGNGFFPDTATGRTDAGNALPTFSLQFKRGTPLGWQPASADGFATTASGRTVSAVVPEPSGGLLALGGILLLTNRRGARRGKGSQ